MNIPFVDLHAQYRSIKQEIDAVVSDVIENSAFIGGNYVQTFEENFAKYCDVKHCIGVGNGTDALYISLRVCGISEGDEVITAANSFIATSEAISMTGAKVVFADINPATYNLDVSKLEEKITDKTKAIVPVHLYGQPADMDAILELAEKYNLKIVEDAAQAHGAVYQGKTIGSIGDIGCFSFYPGKNLGAYGDAGAIVTNDDDLARVARMTKNHGRIDKYDHEFEGVNSRLDGLQAAVLGVKLQYLSEWSKKRRENAYLYNKYLADLDVVTPAEIDNVSAVYHLYVVRIDKDKRSAFQVYLKEKGISSGIHYPITLPNLQAYGYLGHKESDFSVASKAAKEIVSLPIFPELQEDQIRYIADTVRGFLAK